VSEGELPCGATRNAMPHKHEDADLSGAEFLNCKLAGAKFDDVNLSHALFHNVSLKNAKFDDVNLSHVVIHNANCSHLALEDACVEGMTIQGIPVKQMIELYRKQNPQS
jgi:uncharacterized protein YjbI with pentapeptide repeats